MMVEPFIFLMLGIAASLLFAVNHAKHLKIRELQASIVYERVAWCHAALEVILWWHDQYEDGDGPPPAIRELERLHARYDGGFPDSDPQRQADWINARLDELYRMGADR